MSGETYAEVWANAINETYTDDAEEACVTDAALDGESYEDAEKRILTKAAQCLRNGIPATFTAGELDLVRHMMPAHVVHQSYAVRWITDRYGPPA